MKAKALTLTTLIAVLAPLLSGAATAQSSSTQALMGARAETQVQPSANLPSGPVIFIENVGQFDPSTGSRQAPRARSRCAAVTAPSGWRKMPCG